MVLHSTFLFNIRNCHCDFQCIHKVLLSQRSCCVTSLKVREAVAGVELGPRASHPSTPETSCDKKVQEYLTLRYLAPYTFMNGNQEYVTLFT